MSVFAYYYGRVPETLLYSDASDRACRLHALLTRWADTRPDEHPTREQLGKMLNCSADSASRAIKELHDRGFLNVMARHDPETGSQLPNAYVLEGYAPVHTPPAQERVGGLPAETGKAAGKGGRSPAEGGVRTGAKAYRKKGSKNTTEGSANGKTTNALLKQYIDSLPERPPDREVGQLARNLAALLGEGTDAGLLWQVLDQDYRHRDVGPAYLPNLVAARQRGATRTNGYRNGQPERRGPTIPEADLSQLPPTDPDKLAAWYDRQLEGIPT